MPMPWVNNVRAWSAMSGRYHAQETLRTSTVIVFHIVFIDPPSLIRGKG